MLDILIKNGRYADFDRGALVYGDVGVRDGTIAAVGSVAEDARRVVDAAGKIVTTGFVDIHMHEENFAREGDRYDIALRMLRMGVTTAVAGNCGGQSQSVAEFRNCIERLGGAPCNYLLLAGYNRARRLLAGLGEHERASEAQIDLCAAHLASEIEGGASGISFGVEYDPGIEEEEIIRVIAAQRPGVFASMHYRDEGEAAIASVEEMIRIAKATGARFQISHLSSCAAMGQMEEALRLINRANEENPLLDYDTYPYNAFCTHIGSVTFDGDRFERLKAANAPILIASGAHAGKIVEDRALFDQIRAEKPSPLAVVFEMRENEIGMAVANRECGMVASDGVLMGGLGHPRAAGTFPRILAKYVREENALSMMCALKKMSVAPAGRMNLVKKTRVAPGYDADLVVFDPHAVQDRATFEQPNLPPAGFGAVIVNGRLAIMDDEVVDARAGRFIQSL